MEPLVLAALHGCRNATERSAVWNAVQWAADDISCLCEPDTREVRWHTCSILWNLPNSVLAWNLEATYVAM